MNLQHVAKHGFEKYLAKYISKPESSFEVKVFCDVLRSAESDKKKKYLQACQDRRAAFTPLCVSVDGLLGKEADFFIHRMCDFCVISGRNLSV